MKNDVDPALVAAEKAAFRAWREQCDQDKANTPEVIRLAKVSARLTGELRLAKMGKARKALPAGHEHCKRCGGFGGSSQWPGWGLLRLRGFRHRRGIAPYAPGPDG